VPNNQKHRIFVGQELCAGLEVELGPEQTHYIRRVLRLKSSDTLICFDGNGSSFVASILDSQSRPLRLLLDSEHNFQKVIPARIHLIHALIKKPEKVFQKATELGVTDIWPISSQRSEAHLNPQRLEKKIQHWNRIILSACEQSGRNRIPQLHSVHAFTDIVQNPPAEMVYLLQPGSPTFQPPSQPKDICLVVGPEGGWAQDELQLALGAGFIAAGFGNNVLRADTAPMTALSILQHSWNWQFA
jgi:16S rRNA (uracil1498-N3)-methyltransferase